MNSQLMCSNVGHGNRRIADAIKEQADVLAYAGPSAATEVRARIGEELSRITPGNLDKFFFTLGGAEANENAIKMARAFTGRHKIVARYRSYHGSTAAAISLTGDQRRWANEPGISGVVRMPDPYMYRSPLYREGDTEEDFTARCLNQIEEILMYEGPHTVAAFIIETVTGTNGIIIPPKGYLQGLRAICDKYGILLICDEVMAGVGRTGEWFACDNWGVVPDLLTMAKGLTSAYMPLGCVAVSPKIADYFGNNVFYGGLTYSAHPMCLAAAVATLKVMQDDNLVGNSKRMGEKMRAHHQRLKAKHPSVGDVRNIGLFGCLELVKNRKTKEPMGPYVGADPHITKMGTFLKEQGLYVFQWKNFLHTNPPLTVTEKELDYAFGIIDKALDIADQGVVADPKVIRPCKCQVGLSCDCK